MKNLWMLSLVAVASACAGEGSKSEPPGAIGPRPTHVSVAPSQVEMGFFYGKRRKTVATAGFSIAKHPVTVGQYRACGDAGSCTLSESCLKAMALQSEQHAVACLSVEHAAEYCEWSGGHLPTPQQWMGAARGSAVAKYAWGSAEPECEHHPSACEALAVPVVGSHPNGASPAGLEDVLLYEHEYLSTGTGCGYARGCRVVGRGRGPIISGLVGVATPAPGEAIKPSSDTTFRCVWEEKS